MKGRRRRELSFKLSIVFIILLIFCAGFGYSLKCIKVLLNEDEFKACEEIAQSVYNQENQVILEVPKEYDVTVNATQIIVKSSSIWKRGKVKAYVENGNLVFERDNETAYAIATGVVIGIANVILNVVIIVVLIVIAIKISNVREKRCRKKKNKEE